MTIKKFLFELVLNFFSIGARPKKIGKIQSIFVLRNNDIGDLLVITPLFESLKLKNPEWKIIAGIGKWNEEILKGNPYVDQVIFINAPWHNKFVKKQGILHSLKYIFSSAEVKELKKLKIDLGIDVLGSQYGSLLMMKAGIRSRIGVKGYAEGYSVTSSYGNYNPSTHVGAFALQLGDLIDHKSSTVNLKPQLYLSKDEDQHGIDFWKKHGTRKVKIVIGPGAGLEDKCWPVDYYAKLVELIKNDLNVCITITGSKADQNKCNKVGGSSEVINICGDTTLREVFSIVKYSDLVICNSSMLMHVAAAFNKPSIVLLGESYSSAQAHKLQWGYESTIVLGIEKDKRDIYSPNEVLPFVRKSLNF